MFLLGLALISASALVSREVSMSTAPAAGSMPRISTVAFISTEGYTAVTAAPTQAGGTSRPCQRQQRWRRVHHFCQWRLRFSLWPSHYSSDCFVTVHSRLCRFYGERVVSAALYAFGFGRIAAQRCRLKSLLPMAGGNDSCKAIS